MTHWIDLKTARATTLRAARLDCHFAAQVVTALGRTHLPPAPDASHTNLSWDPALGSLVGREVAGLRAALSLSDLRWHLLRGDDDLSSVRAAQLSVTQGLAWLRAKATAAGLPDLALTRDPYDLPDSAPGETGPLGTSQAADRDQVAAWFQNASLSIQQLIADVDGASELVCWPHHFDLASLVTLPASGEQGRSVGVGMSPGDDGIDEPYFYVNPWPRPQGAQLPTLPSGSWHTAGWFGAVLRASELPAAGDPSAQQAALKDFLSAALPAAVALAQQ